MTDTNRSKLDDILTALGTGTTPLSFPDSVVTTARVELETLREQYVKMSEMVERFTEGEDVWRRQIFGKNKELHENEIELAQLRMKNEALENLPMRSRDTIRSLEAQLESERNQKRMFQKDMYELQHQLETAIKAASYKKGKKK